MFMCEHGVVYRQSMTSTTTKHCLGSHPGGHYNPLGLTVVANVKIEVPQEDEGIPRRSTTPLKYSKRGGYAELVSQDLSPHPKAEGGYPLVRRGKCKLTGTEPGGNKNRHPCPLPLNVSKCKRVQPLLMRLVPEPLLCLR